MASRNRRNPNIISSSSDEEEMAINIREGRERNLGYGPPENRVILPTRRPRVVISPIGWPGQPAAVVDAAVQTTHTGPLMRLSRRRIQHDAETSMDDGQRPSTSAQAGIKKERASGMVQVKKEVVSYYLKDLPEYQGAAAATWHSPQFTPAEGGQDSDSASGPDPWIYYGSDSDSAPSLD